MMGGVWRIDTGNAPQGGGGHAFENTRLFPTKHRHGTLERHFYSPWLDMTGSILITRQRVAAMP